MDKYFIDTRFNIYNYDKYSVDLFEKKFTKLCMTEVVNADLMIATFGEDEYIKGCREVLEEIIVNLKITKLNSLISLYMINYKNFILAANDEISDADFEIVMKAMYENYERASSQNVALNAVSRFVLVLGGENLVDRAKSAHYTHRKSQQNYIMASNEKEVMIANAFDVVKVFDLINKVISSGSVIPYYQGIYNNRTQSITKYEALMRIADEDGNIYAPGIFIDIAKQYKLYGALSNMMIKRALEDFRDLESELCLNISIFDIENKAFQEWFLDTLRSYPNVSRVTVEFVESEDYNNHDKLYGFLSKIKEIGCKIAVDDFGAGFATFSSIVSLKPDIVKIDGSIIKNLANDVDNNTIVHTICYMAKLINAEVVAEFVENDEIQDMILSEGIYYSQGYYFAKPLPFEKLSIK